VQESSDLKPELRSFQKPLPQTAIAIVLSTTILCTAVPRPKQLEPPPDPNLADILCFWAKAVKDEVDLQLQLDRRPRCYYLPLFLTVDTGQGREWYCVWPQGTSFNNGKTCRMAVCTLAGDGLLGRPTDSAAGRLHRLMPRSNQSAHISSTSHPLR
jgi:hypothetical protein